MSKKQGLAAAGGLGGGGGGGGEGDGRRRPRVAVKERRLEAGDRVQSARGRRGCRPMGRPGGPQGQPGMRDGALAASRCKR